MKELSISNVTVKGDLRTRLIKNFSRLHDKIYHAGKAGLPPYCCIGWPGDWEGRAMLALALDSEVLRTEAGTFDKLVEWIYSLLNDEGYRSEPNDKLNLEDINEQMHAAQNWLTRAFLESYRITGEEKYLETAKQILKKLYLPIKDHLKNYPHSAADRVAASDNAVVGHTSGQFKEWRLSSDIGCVFIGLDVVGQSLSEIKEEPLLTELNELADAMIEALSYVDYVGEGLQTHATLSGMRGLMRIYKVRKDPAILNIITKYFEDYEKFGMTANYENQNCFTRIGHTEPCGMVDSYMLACQLWEETGKRHYLDISHKIWWNAFMRAQRENGGMGCDGTADDGIVNVFGVFYEAYHCCTMRGAEGLGYPVRHAVYEDGNTALIPFYFDFDARLSNGALIAVRTEYPIEGKVSLKVKEGGKPAEVKLYIPEWAENVKITINGVQVGYTMTDECFAAFECAFNAGDEVLLTFAQTLRKVPCERYWHAGKNRCTLEYGTLVLGTEKRIDKLPELDSFKYEGNGKFSAGEYIFEPLHECILLSKEEVMAKSWQVVFDR